MAIRQKYEVSFTIMLNGCMFAHRVSHHLEYNRTSYGDIYQLIYNDIKNKVENVFKDRGVRLYPEDTVIFIVHSMEEEL